MLNKLKKKKYKKIKFKQKLNSEPSNYSECKFSAISNNF